MTTPVLQRGDTIHLHAWGDSQEALDQFEHWATLQYGNMGVSVFFTTTVVGTKQPVPSPAIVAVFR